MSSETLDSPNIEMAPVLRPKNALTRADQHMEVARQGKLIMFNLINDMKSLEILILPLTDKYFIDLVFVVSSLTQAVDQSLLKTAATSRIPTTQVIMGPLLLLATQYKSAILVSRKYNSPGFYF